ncbi:outer membrane protein assembly factor BamC [Pleionea litopenaei]|uniref:Outer membrane protein assembly factor BamC n=1 Tax=Pleionea litopenaei TaxID=3070815 RepID=A0AA51X7T6_9GAMM|nr:outer membrane protein assembly factor BamC [Pleionea sp. HL-JVS1]WMS87445.1 outer membrane protein assembly factor BamC [Pleionea sp. HL-JVS1]
MKYLTIIALSSSAFLSGCSWLYSENGLVHDSTNDYKKAKQTQPLKVPEGYSTDKIQNQYVVPNVASGVRQVETPELPPLQILSVGQGMRLNRSSAVPSIFWMTNFAHAEKSLQEFLEHKELSYQSSERSATTDWQVQDNEAWWRSVFGTDLPRFVRSQYRVSFASGEQPGEVAVLVEEIALQKQPYDEDKWQTLTPTDRGARAFLNEFIGYIDYLERLDNARKLQQLNQGFTVTLGRNSDSNAALVADTKFDIAWLKVPEVLAPFGFTLNDKDVSRATYFFEFEANEPGFFASLVGDDEGVVLQLPKGPYQVVVQKQAPVTISFINPDGEPLSDGVMAQIFPHLAEAFGRQTRTKRR